MTQKIKAANRKVLGMMKMQRGERLEEDKTKQCGRNPWPHDLALVLATCSY